PAAEWPVQQEIRSDQTPEAAVETTTGYSPTHRTASLVRHSAPQTNPISPAHDPDPITTEGPAPSPGRHRCVLDRDAKAGAAAPSNGQPFGWSDVRIQALRQIPSPA